MIYAVDYSSKAIRALEKIDRPSRSAIRDWIKINLVGCDNPRLRGKALSGPLGDLWRYRIGDYRIIAEIKDANVTILIVDVGHRRYIYK
jgi:mRNA interferase RelE/StbE